MLDKIFFMLYDFTHLQLGGIYLVQFVAFPVLVLLLWFSRLVANVQVKVFAIMISVIIYFFPYIMSMYTGG